MKFEAKCKHGYKYEINDERIITSAPEDIGKFSVPQAKASMPVSLCPHCFLELCRNFNMMEYWRNGTNE